MPLTIKKIIKQNPPLTLFSLFFVLFATQSILGYLTFYIKTYDLSVYTQALYLYSHGLPAFSSIVHLSMIANHFEPILLLFSPLYYLFPSPITLLIIQALLSTASIFALYPIIYDKTKEIRKTCILIITYLTSTGILYAINFDFHTTTISVLPLSIMLYAWYFRKNKLYLIATLFAILFKEDIPLFILGLGALQLISKQWKLAAFSIITAVTTLLIVYLVITPHFTSNNTIHSNNERIKTTDIPLSSPASIPQFFLTHPLYIPQQLTNSPVKINSLLVILADYGFLPLFSVISYLLVFPYLFLRFTSNYSNLWEIIWHHNANLEPFLLLASTYGIANLVRLLRTKEKTLNLIFVLLLCAGIAKVTLFTVKSIIYRVRIYNDYAYVYKSLPLIPPNAPVAAQWPLAAHLANRKEIYVDNDIKGAEYIILDSNLALKEKDIQEEIQQTGNITSKEKLTALPSSEDIVKIEKQLVESNRWKLIHRNKTLIILKKQL